MNVSGLKEVYQKTIERRAVPGLKAAPWRTYRAARQANVTLSYFGSEAITYVVPGGTLPDRQPSLASSMTVIQQPTAFLYAVRMHHHCRPTCLKAARENVAFYLSPRMPEAAGYRACQRCRRPDAASAVIKSWLRRCNVCSKLSSPEPHCVTFAETFKPSSPPSTCSTRHRAELLNSTPRPP